MKKIAVILIVTVVFFLCYQPSYAATYDLKIKIFTAGCVVSPSSLVPDNATKEIQSAVNKWLAENKIAVIDQKVSTVITSGSYFVITITIFYIQQ